MDNKRKQDEEHALMIKRPRQDELAIGSRSSTELSTFSTMPGRTSSLQSPIMLLSGHQGEVFTCKFNPEGTALASGSFDRDIFLWHLHGDCVNYMVLKGHQGAVLELHWSSDGNYIFSASSDKTAIVWDAIVGQRVKRIREHHNYINSCCPNRRGTQLLATGSDDTSARVFDLRVRSSIHSFSHKFPVTSVSFSDGGDQLFTGGIDNIIRVWDLRKNDVLFTLNGHTDTITGMRLSPDGSYLLSNAMDNTVRIWDIRPYAPAQRNVKTFSGVQHSYEKNLLKCSWSPDGSKISAGSSDRFVYIWDTTTRKIMYKLPGHSGSVNEVDFHPREPIIASGGSDKQIYLGELQREQAMF